MPGPDGDAVWMDGWGGGSEGPLRERLAVVVRRGRWLAFQGMVDDAAPAGKAGLGALAIHCLGRG